MDTVLLAGGSGFVGKNLAHRLSGQFKVAVVDRAIDGAFFSQHPDVRTYACDLAAPLELDRILVEANPQIIVNLVSIVTAERDLSLFEQMVRTNLGVLLQLYNASGSRNDVKLFVQFGSAEEYGGISTPYRESAREEPGSPYSLVKQLTTNTTLMLHRNYGFPACVVRPGNLFGRHQPGNKLLPYLIAQLSRNLPLELTPGEQKRDFIHVEDLADILAELFRAPERTAGRILNIAYGHGVKVRELVEFLKKALGSSSELRFGSLPYRENEMMDFECDIRELEGVLQHGIRRDFFDALRAFLREGYGVQA